MRLLSTMLALIALVVPWSQLQADSPADEGALALRIAELISRADLSGAAAALHYPPSWSDEQREQDAAAVERSLQFYTEQFGTVSGVTPQLEPILFYEVGAGGGDMPYWQNISPSVVNDYLFSVKFSKLGEGLLKIRAVRHPTVPMPTIQSIGFGLPAAREGAKAKIIEVTKGLLRLKGMQLPPNIDQILNDQLRPVERQEAASGAKRRYPAV